MKKPKLPTSHWLDNIEHYVEWQHISKTLGIPRELPHYLA